MENTEQSKPFFLDKNLLSEVISTANNNLPKNDIDIKYSQIKNEKNFDFINLSRGKKSNNKNNVDLYYSEGELQKIIIKHASKIPDNTTLLLYHTQEYIIIYPIAYYPDKTLMDLSESGFFYLNKKLKTLYFFGVGRLLSNHKVGEIELYDLRSIMIVDSNLKPTGHIQFFNKGFFINTSLLYNNNNLYYEKVVSLYEDIKFSINDSSRFEELTILNEVNNKDYVVYPPHKYKRYYKWVFAPYYKCITSHELEIKDNKLYDVYNNLVDDTLRTRYKFSEPYAIEY